VKYTYLHIDFETFSLANLKEVGLDNYAKHPSTGVSMLAWAADDEDVEVWLPHLIPMPERLLTILLDPAVLIVAWHAAFERNIFKYVLKIDIPIERFRDPIVLAHNLSLPGKLKSVGSILKMKEQKDPRGEDLVKMFCNPVSEGGEMTLFGMTTPLFRDHNSHPREFAEYVEYCKQDVRAERDLWHRLVKIPFPERDWQGWFLDQKINAFGMPGRRDLAEKGLRLVLKYLAIQEKLLKEKTGLQNPVHSDPQMKEWVTARGYPWKTLRAPTVTVELDNPASPITKECREALVLRASARKTSYSKIETFLRLLSSDNRLKNQFNYMGAARTGRWKSGGGEDTSMQVQNMSRGMKAVKKNLMLALDLLAREDYDGIVQQFTNTKNPKDSISVMDFVISLLRSLFQATSGKKFLVSDKNAIENRMLGWAAACPAISEVFQHSKEDGGDPYLAFGTHLYNKTYAEMWATYISGNEEERQNSKPPVLGGGYALGGGDMYINSDGDTVRGGLWGYALSVCGVDMSKELAHKAVKILREAWPEVVQFWTDLEEAFKQVLKRGGVVKVGEVTWDKRAMEWVEHSTKGQQCVITFRRKKMEDGGYMIRMELPSGRALHYLNATVEEEQRTSQKTGRPYTAYTIYYDGIEHSATQDAEGKTVKKRHKWGRVKTYGGKLCENAIQAMSRDDLLNSMLLADEMGFSIWGLFHDEIATEVEDSPFGLRLEDLNWCMTSVPDWAPGLLLGAEGYESKVYKKS
jgi:DNA polymerase bacteriophage-type